MATETAGMSIYDGTCLCGTGGFLVQVMSGLHIRHTPGFFQEEVLQNPWFAGYCLDAPDYLPAGSMQWNDNIKTAQTRIVAR